jgi:hypothetical protein
VASAALIAWTSGAAISLDEVVAAHQKLGGTKPGRRALTEINYAYATRLAAHFQGYARALHSQASAAIAAGIADENLRIVVQTQLTQGRLLDKGNANAANIGADFGRFGFKVWDKVTEDRVPNADRKRKLDELLEWRNGIAHDDLARRHADGTLVPPRMTMAACRAWRRALDNLAPSFDRVVAEQVENLGRPRPW